MSLYGPLVKLEEERRRRRLQELDARFQMSVERLDQIQKINEEFYEAKKKLMSSAERPKEPEKVKIFPSLKAAKPSTRKNGKHK
jgi:hypothetical protein